MIKIYKILFYIILPAVFAGLSCEAPRTNPLDPLNPDKPLTAIEGTVKAVSFPYSPIKDVRVFWQNDNIIVSTNDQGKFMINNIRPINGWLIFVNDNYAADSLFINWDSRKKKTISFSLNAKPVLDSIEFYSIVLNRFQYSQTTDLYVRTKVSDPDGVTDIDSVNISSTKLRLCKPLAYNVNTLFYETKLTISELGLTSIDEVIGKDFEIVIKSHKGSVFNYPGLSIKRIIKQEIEILSPANRDLFSVPFKLNWKRFTPGFTFKYLIQISTDTSPPEIVWQTEGVSSDSISYPVTQPLQQGEYFWTIWAIDEFKNRTRSKPATFLID